MDGIVCDGCGEGLLLEEDVRYILKVEGYAAYDPLELTAQDLQRDLRGEVAELLEEMGTLDAETAQDQVHRSFQFDLCARCWMRYIKDPLRGVDPRGPAGGSRRDGPPGASQPDAAGDDPSASADDEGKSGGEGESEEPKEKKEKDQGD